MEKPYPIKSPHPPFAKPVGKNGKFVPRGAGWRLEAWLELGKEEIMGPPGVLELLSHPMLVVAGPGQVGFASCGEPRNAEHNQSA